MQSLNSFISVFQFIIFYLLKGVGETVMRVLCKHVRALMFRAEPCGKISERTYGRRIRRRNRGHIYLRQKDKKEE
jgi:hypothetical protein